MKSILIVEDEHDNRELLSEVITRWGYRAITAADGREGIEAFEKNSVDLVISDLKMPNVDGVSFLELIRERDQNVAFIVLTGYPSIDSAVRTMKNGAFDYLVKPLDMEEFRTKLMQALSRNGSQEDMD
jgi:DNA-binding NtrC family response regulator